MAPNIIAHRGASYDAPENTLTAFRLAWQQGADGIEGDFYLTRDGQIVCLHDKTTARVGERVLPVAGSALAELRQVDVGRWKGPQWAGERLPTLGEVLATIPGDKMIFMELKSGPEIIEPLAIELARSGLEARQAAAIAFDPDVIAGIKRRLPRLKAHLLLDTRKPVAGDILANLDRIQADGVDLAAWPEVGRDLVAELHAARKECHVWTVDDPAAARRFREIGVDSITTNRPGWLRQQLGN
jgi:glycerophosphoryl diester phosphodiesterase